MKNENLFLIATTHSQHGVQDSVDVVNQHVRQNFQKVEQRHTMYFCSQKVYSPNLQQLQQQPPQGAQQPQMPQPNSNLPPVNFGAKYHNPPNLYQPMPPQLVRPNLPQPQPLVPMVNTNVLSINLGELGKEQTVATGDCVFCQSCQAIFNSTSKITLSKGAQREWECMEFFLITKLTLLTRRRILSATE
jgi:hypothetical protein